MEGNYIVYIVAFFFKRLVFSLLIRFVLKNNFFTNFLKTYLAHKTTIMGAGRGHIMVMQYSLNACCRRLLYLFNLNRSLVCCCPKNEDKLEKDNI